MGAPLLAMLITLPELNTVNILRMAHALIAFFFGWTHGYTMNEWGGYEGDSHDPSKAKRPLLAGQISRREILMFSLICAGICVILYSLLDPKLLFLVGLSLFIGLLYNHPRITLKKVPFASLFVLFVVSISDTLLGWLVFSSVLYQGCLVGGFFGLLGFAGICYHEAGDYESDRTTGIATNAVRYGKKPVFILGFVFYSISCVYFIFLTILNIIPTGLFLGFVFSYPVYIYLFYRCIKRGMDTTAIHDFINQYRTFYGVVGLYMVLYLILM